MGKGATMARVPSLVRNDPARLCLALLLLVSLVVVSARVWYFGARAMAGDGVFYYAYLRSPIIDRDLDFHYEMARALDQGALDIYAPWGYTPTGNPSNPFSVGPAIAWSPFFALAHLTTLVMRHWDIPVEADGYSTPYLLAVSWGSVIYGWLALVLTYLICRRFFTPFFSLLATLLVWAASNVAYYHVVLPFFAHTLSFLAVALFIFAWLSLRASSGWRKYLLLGALLGFAALTRWQEVWLIVLPLGEMAERLWRARGARLGRAAAEVANGGLLAGAAALVFIPQMLVWGFLYGDFLTVPQGEGFLTWRTPQVLEVLFSTRHGLFSWTPITLLGLVGLVAFSLRRSRGVGLPLLAFFALQLYTNSIASDWWGGWAFGARRFIDLAPLFALGLGSLLEHLRQWGRAPLLAAAGALFLLLAYNGLFILQYVLRLIPHGDALTLEEMTIDKWKVLPAMIDRFPGIMGVLRGG